jgi:uncharacterized protein YjbI with pentapeptide repeats
MLTHFGRALEEKDLKRDRFLKISVQRFIDRTGLEVLPDFNKAEMSQRPPDWIGDESDENNHLKRVRGVLMRDQNLRYAKASNAFLINGDFSRSDMTGADLVGADMRGASFTETKLRNSLLVGTNLNHAFFHDADLSNSVMMIAKLDNVFMTHVKLNGVYLEFSELKGAIFFECNFENADLRRTKFVDVVFVDCSFNGTDLRGVDLSKTTGVTPKTAAHALIDLETKWSQPRPSKLASGKHVATKTSK